jgi:predicted ATPase
MGEYGTAHAHLQHVIAFYEPQKHHHDFIFVRGSDAGVSAMAYDACCLWCLGYPDQAQELSRKAKDLARELGHAFSLADTICFGGCVLNQMRRDIQALKKDAEELKRVSEGMSFISFAGTGNCYTGEALARLGEVEEGVKKMHLGMEIRQSVGALCYLTGILGTLAETQIRAGQVEEGLATFERVFARIEETDERYLEAELNRIHGELMLLLGDQDRAEASLQKAFEVARQQGAKSWELRIATSLARLWQEQGRSKEARSLLAPIYKWFTEGLDTPDMQEAKALLNDLS